MENLVKVSDLIALFLKEKGIKHVFGIIGAANSHIFDSIARLGFTQIVCVHHEQAATMAMQTYYRVRGKITAAIVTAGGGSTNAVTGVVSAWADSIPGMVISGQENTKYINAMKNLRMWGVQGFDSTAMVEKVTKYSTRVWDANKILFELEKAYDIAGAGRPGPVWVDIPMDIQGSMVEKKNILRNYSPAVIKDDYVLSDIDNVFDLIAKSKRPVFWIGNGIRLSGAQDRIHELLSIFPFPTITAWAGLDILPTDNPLNFGRAGNYGNRSANLIVQNADLLIVIGTRLSLPMIGYTHDELARAAKKVMVDIDKDELLKLSDIIDVPLHMDAGRFLDILINGMKRKKIKVPDITEWRTNCEDYRARYPLVGPEHEDKNGYINSYRFIDRLSHYFKPDQVVTTDMGTALLSGHEAVRIKEGQRMMTSTGLGEMGYGLPAAIGASFARDKGEVMCLNCDGGMMMNLQELQTIVYHKLPIKIFIFNNNGYLMIKHTQKSILKGNYVCVGPESGVGFPDYSKIAVAFGIPYFSIRTWDDFNKVISSVQESKSAVFCEVFMDPEQYFYPKQSVAITNDGKIVSPPLEDTSPLLSREELKKNMIIGLHRKSENLK